MIFARFVLAGFNYRPGLIARAAPIATPGVSRGEDLFMHPDLGVWGYFTHQQMPGIQVLCTAADADGIAGGLLVIRVGGPEALPAPR